MNSAVDEMWRRFEEADRRREERLPDLHSCLLMALEVKQRLEKLGWSKGVYMPKDGTIVQIVEWGSTGVFKCSYSGEWPGGYFNTMDDRDIYPSSQAPLAWKALPT